MLTEQCQYLTHIIFALCLPYARSLFALCSFFVCLMLVLHHHHHHHPDACQQHAGRFGACSRNCEVSDHPGSKDNYIWDQIKMLNLSESLPALGRSLALQGELVGPDLQSNKLRLQHRALRLFRIFDIDRQMFLPTDDFLQVAAALNVKTVPIIQRSLVLDHTVDQLVEMATGRTVVPSETAQSKGTALPLREGLVFVFEPIDAGGADGNGAAPALSAPRSFKVINPMFLLKHEC
jgi:hypothetical protein